MHKRERKVIHIFVSRLTPRHQICCSLSATVSSVTNVDHRDRQFHIAMPRTAQDSSSSCPVVPLSNYSSNDMLMLRCQQHLSRLVAAAAANGGADAPLPMLTRIGNMQPHAGTALAAEKQASGCKRDRMERCPSFSSLSSSSDDELCHVDKRATLCDPEHLMSAEVWQPDPLLADDLIEGLDSDFWQAQTDLSSGLGELAGDGFDAGFDPCFMAKHAEGAQKRPWTAPASPPPASTLSAKESLERSSSPCFVGVLL